MYVRRAQAREAGRLAVGLWLCLSGQGPLPGVRTKFTGLYLPLLQARFLAQGRLW